MIRRRALPQAATLEAAICRTGFDGQPWTVKGGHCDRHPALIGGQMMLAIALAANAVGTAHAQAPEPRPSSHISRPTGDDTIGMASREVDGTIILTLRAEGPSCLIGDARFRYTPDDPDYGIIARHVGPIPPGVAVQIRPFEAR